MRLIDEACDGWEVYGNAKTVLMMFEEVTV